MEKRFVYFSTKAKFLNATLGNEYDFTSIVFIGDSKEIWNRGILYGTPNDFDINDYLPKADAAATYQPKGNYLTAHQSLEEYAKTADVNTKFEGYYTKEEVDSAVESVDVTEQLEDYVKLEKLVEELAKKADKDEIPSLDGYATESWVEAKNYLTEHQSLEDYAKKSDVESAVKEGIDSIIDGASEAMDTLKEVEAALGESADTVAAINAAIGNKADKSEITDMATKTWVGEQNYLTEHQSLDNYYTKDEVATLVGDNIVDLTGYATEEWVENKNYLTEHQSLEEYAKKEEVSSGIDEVVEEIAETYYSKEELNTMFEWAEY